MSYPRNEKLKIDMKYDHIKGSPGDLAKATPFPTFSTFALPFGSDPGIDYRAANGYTSPQLDLPGRVVYGSGVVTQNGTVKYDDDFPGLHHPYSCSCGGCVAIRNLMTGSAGLRGESHPMEGLFIDYISSRRVTNTTNTTPNISISNGVEQLPTEFPDNLSMYLTPKEASSSNTKQPPGKRFSCPYNCGYWFTRKGDAQRHSRNHEVSKPFRCWVEGCKYKKKGFARKDKRKSHMKNVHQLSEDPDTTTSDAFIFEYCQPGSIPAYMPQTPSYGNQSAPSVSPPSGSQSTIPMSPYSETPYESPLGSQIDGHLY